MSNYDNSGQIGVWKNTDKKSDKSPDYTGHFEADRDIRKGEKIYFGLWKNEAGGDKRPVLKGKLDKPRDNNARQATRQSPPPQKAQDFDDDLPF